ncbi:ABC transporter substrate-binding protein [Desertimonas flava]|uniref:ABC transporter substrate-binding protein n=1 Tax=Desertimonas flava TaxID=2064846 RepID=UPI000E3412F3|nr:ABC transporter substrate-binding protein [Desertimonas flava]
MTIHRRPGRLLLGAAAIAVTSVTAVASGGAGVGAADGSLGLLLPLIPASWDTRETAGYHNVVQLAVTEPLTAYAADGAITPLLASEAEHPDPTTYVYTLRPDVQFSDGSPLTAEDVKFSFELHMGEENPSYRARFFAGIESIEVAGDQVTVTLAEPDPEFPYAVASLGIVSKANYEAHPDDIGTPAAPQIGTGPYVIADFSPAEEVTLEPNPGYWGEAPAYESLTYSTASDDSSRLLALQSGDFDGVLLPPVHQIPAIQGLGAYTEYSTFDPTIYRVIFDTTKPPFDDIHVRNAIAHAIDREAIVAGVFGGNAELADSVVLESVVADMGGDTDVATVFDEFAAAFEYDLDAARAELAQSSVPDGFEIEVPVFSEDPTQALVAQVMAPSLAEIGIDISISQVDMNGWVGVFLEGEGDGLIIDQWSAGSPDPATVPRSLFTPGAAGNFSKLDDPAVNDALAAYVAADGDAATQQATLVDTLTAAQAVTPYVPLAFPNLFVYLDDDVVLNAVTPYFWMVPFDEAFTSA